MGNSVEAYSLFTDYDIQLFKSGKHFRLYDKLGSHTVEIDGKTGVYFAVWAPNALKVAVAGDWNTWSGDAHQLNPRWDHSGIWEGVIFGIGIGNKYKYAIQTERHGLILKSDPYAVVSEEPPRTASIVGTTWKEWKDEDWMKNRKEHNRLDRPFSVYELHLGSWLRDANDPERFLSYQELSQKLVPYVKEMGFTHVEFMPVMEHPYYPSWGYQIIGMFSAGSRFGGPQALMHLIEEFHRNDIGVILDWVPSHFPGDAHGLREFDGTALYEHEDMRQGFHPDWKSYVFNYGRNEVRSYLISNALFWLDRYHADGLRVDAVASMLYLDYSRKEGEWVPNRYGGKENLEAVSFLKEFNETVYADFPDVQTIAEESTAWPNVSKPLYDGGLGFGMKWMMGWMHDTLNYFKEDPINRKYHHDQMTFATVYAYSENFMLPLSHDEVVYGKQSLIYKMPGDEWQKFANLRALFLYMYTFSGTKLIFMGGEFGQTHEWNVNQSLDWHLLQFAPHKGLQDFFKRLNHLYTGEPALYEKSFSPEGFEWIELSDWQKSVFVYCRKGHDAENDIVVALNLTPVLRDDFRIGVPHEGEWEVLLNSDDKEFFGSGVEVKGAKSEPREWMNQELSIPIVLPPLSGIVLKMKPGTYVKKVAKAEKTKRPTGKKATAKSVEDKPKAEAKVKKTTTKKASTEATVKIETAPKKAAASKSAATKSTTKTTAKKIEKKADAEGKKPATKKAADTAAKKTTVTATKKSVAKPKGTKTVKKPDKK